jgi:hypothetical protein
MSVIHGGCSALLRYLIFDVADVRLEWCQPTHVDQPGVSAAVNIAGGVFAAVAGDNLTYQLEVLVVHVDPLVQIACSPKYLVSWRRDAGRPGRNL